MAQAEPQAQAEGGRAPDSAAADALMLSLVARSDAPDLIRVNQASAGLHRPWIFPFTNEAGFLNWYQGGLAGANVNLLVRDRNTRAPVSVVSFENVVGGAFWNANLSYYGMAGQVGRGRQTAAVRLALGYGFGRLGMHRFEAAVQPANARSRALLERLGFRYEGLSREFLMVDGQWRDHERWALLRSEFRP